MALHSTAADLLLYYDERTVRELLSDSGQPAAGDLSADPRLAVLLKAASGRLEAACFVSENYSADELATMSENSRSLAAELCSTLVMAMLMRRRPTNYTVETIEAMTSGAEDYLQQLRNGARLFDVGNHAKAGKPSVEFPTTAEIADLNSITQRTKNFYPNPAARLPISRGGG